MQCDGAPLLQLRCQYHGACPAVGLWISEMSWMHLSMQQRRQRLRCLSTLRL